MSIVDHAAPAPTVSVWIGRVLSGLLIAFLVFDGAIKDRTMQGKVARGASAGGFTLHRLHAISPALAAELSGSYEIDAGRVIDLGVMDDAGGLLVFLDQGTLREGALYALTDASFVSGPTLGVPYPFVIRAEFRRDAAGAVTGLRWSEGGRDREARATRRARGADGSPAARSLPSA